MAAVARCVGIVIVVVVRFRRTGRSCKSKYLKTKVAPFINIYRVNLLHFLKNNSYSVLSVSKLNCCYRKGKLTAKKHTPARSKAQFLGRFRALKGHGSFVKLMILYIIALASKHMVQTRAFVGMLTMSTAGLIH